MTPKEKATELVERYKSLRWQSGKYIKQKETGVTHYGVSKASQRQMTTEAAKQCALIAVDEILILITAIDGTERWQDYYEEVKTEIENL